MLKHIIAAAILLWVLGPAVAQIQPFLVITPSCEGDTSVPVEQRVFTCASEQFEIRVSFSDRPRWWYFRDDDTDWLLSVFNGEINDLPDGIITHVLGQAFPMRDLETSIRGPMFFRVPTSHDAFCQSGYLQRSINGRDYPVSAFRCFSSSGDYVAIHDLTAKSVQLRAELEMAIISVLLSR